MRTWPIIIALAFFIALGITLEDVPYFMPLKKSLQDRTIPSPLLNFGKRGQIMKRLGLRYVVPKDYETYFDEDTAEFSRRDIISLDTSRLKYRKEWSTTKETVPEKMPSSLVMDETTISKLPTLSVVVDRYDLYDEFTGIFKNYYKRGRNWERPCYLSYYDGGELLFATGAGVRTHGDKIRSHKIKSIRLYFRDIYGYDQFKPGILFDKSSEPLQHLIVRKVSGFPFVNPLAFDISRKMGCYAPYTKPVKLYLNGKIHGHGNFILIEHLSREYVLSHFGYTNFVFYRTKGRKDIPAEYRELVRWTEETVPMTMREAKKRIDLDNFSRWWISQLFCANSDPYQGVALLDRSSSKARWFWINWDMDHSIRNIYERDIKHLWEQRKTIDDLMHQKVKVTKRDPRAILFRRLINGDPAYRKYFMKLMMNVLNHTLTPEYFNSRVNHYKEIAKSFGINTDYIREIRLFLKHRPVYLMLLMKRYCGFPDSYRCTVRAPAPLSLEIDGFNHSGSYTGWYFEGVLLSVKIKNRKNVRYWLVNGKKTAAGKNTLSCRVRSETVIQPIF
jgi:hypothetical protein